MNRSSLSLVVSIALTGAALVACTTDLSRAPSEEGVSQTTQGLRACTIDCDGPADPAPAPTHPKPPPTGTTTPPPPPAPTNVYVPPTGTLPVLQDPTYTFTCNDAGHQLAWWTIDANGKKVASAVPFCWAITDCIPNAVARINTTSSSGTPQPQYWPVCSGFTLVSRSYCSYLLTMSCDPLYGTCQCL